MDFLRTCWTFLLPLFLMALTFGILFALGVKGASDWVHLIGWSVVALGHLVYIGICRNWSYWPHMRLFDRLFGAK